MNTKVARIVYTIKSILKLLFDSSNDYVSIKASFLDYIVFYDRDEIHAIDGLGNGVIILPIHGYYKKCFLIKIN